MNYEAPVAVAEIMPNATAASGRWETPIDPDFA